MFQLRKRWIGLFLLVLIVVLFLSRLEFKDIVYSKNWHPLAVNETVRWMSQDGLVYLFSPNETKIILNLSMIGHFSRTIDISLNNELIGSYKTASSISEPITLKRGENILKFHSQEGCNRPYKVLKNSSDFRCLSIGVERLEVIEEDRFKSRNETITFGNNWYPSEKAANDTHRFMTQDATIFLSPSVEKVKLNISIDTYNKTRNLDLYLNSELIDSYVVNSFFTNIITPGIKLDREINILKFHSREDCDVPNKIENSTDFRCLSFSIKNMTVLSVGKLIEDNKTMIFGNNWYLPENGKRWSSDNSTLFLLLSEQKEAKLNFTVVSYFRPRGIDVYLNGEKIQSFTVEKIPKQFLSKLISIEKGENIIEFRSVPGCDIPYVSEGINDHRCLDFGASDIGILDRDELLERNDSVLYADNWYLPELYGSQEFRWMSDNGTIYLLLNESKLFRLSFTMWGFERNRTVEVYFDDSFVGAYTIEKEGTVMATPLIYADEDEHVVKIRAKEGCDMILSVDNRCLSVTMADLAMREVKNLIPDLDKRYDKNWHELEKYGGDKNFRWMSQNATIELLDFSDKPLKMNLDVLGSYYRPRKIVVLLNEINVAELNVSSESSYNITLPVFRNNTIKFNSIDDCDIPAVLEISKDNRCLSVSVSEIKLYSDVDED